MKIEKLLVSFVILLIVVIAGEVGYFYITSTFTKKASSESVQQPAIMPVIPSTSLSTALAHPNILYFQGFYKTYEPITHDKFSHQLLIVDKEGKERRLPLTATVTNSISVLAINKKNGIGEPASISDIKQDDQVAVLALGKWVPSTDSFDTIDQVFSIEKVMIMIDWK